MRSSVGARGEALGDLGRWKGFGTAAVGKAAGSDGAKYHQASRGCRGTWRALQCLVDSHCSVHSPPTFCSLEAETGSGRWCDLGLEIGPAS